MELVKIIDGQPTPYTEAAFRADNPHTVYGRVVPAKHLNAQDVYRVRNLGKPEEPTGMKAVKDNLPTLNEFNEWVLGWTLVPIPIEEQREKAALPRSTFIVAALDAGILSEADAEQAVNGWPTGWDAFFDGQPARNRIAAKAEWASITTVRRDAPLIEQLRVFKGLTEEQIDQMFGIGG